MPAIWSVVVDTDAAPRWSPRALHHLVTSWLDDRTDDTLGGADHAAPVKDYSVRPPRALGDRSAIDISVLDDDLGTVLLGRASPGTAVQIESWSGQVVEVSAMSTMSWPELCSVAGQHRWRVRFLTPATFRSANRHSPWPEPITVVTGVHRRLRRLYPAGFGELPRLARDTVWVSHCRGDTRFREVPASKSGRGVPGFVGEVVYEVDRAWPGAGEVEKVFRGAEFSGIGAHTGYGLGAVTVHPLTGRRR